MQPPRQRHVCWKHGNEHNGRRREGGDAARTAAPHRPPVSCKAKENPRVAPHSHWQSDPDPQLRPVNQSKKN
jgi:hypothetical protein